VVFGLSSKSASSVGAGDVVATRNQTKITFQFGGGNVLPRCVGKVCMSSEWD
jgi:hypothetical protein